jgi:hypothetical protein
METDPVPAHRPTIHDVTSPDRAAALDLGRADGRMPGDQHPARSARARGWWVGIVMMVGVVALVAAVLFGVHAHRQEQHTDEALASSRTRLHHVETRLGAARTELNGLSTRSAAAGETLAAAENQLESLQSDLSRDEANEFFSGVNIADLDQCLAGVERALNQISLSDPGGAATTLSGVSASCTAAEPSS